VWRKKKGIFYNAHFLSSFKGIMLGFAELQQQSGVVGAKLALSLELSFDTFHHRPRRIASCETQKR
jgi:hypothetical protein